MAYITASPHCAQPKCIECAPKASSQSKQETSADAHRCASAEQYELEAVTAQGGLSGGLENGPIPNHIIGGPNENSKQSDPVTRLVSMTFNSTTGLTCRTRPPIFEVKLQKITLKPAEIVLRAVTWLLPKQRNSIAMIAERPKENHPGSMNPPLLGNPIAKTKKQFRSVFLRRFE